MLVVDGVRARKSFPPINLEPDRPVRLAAVALPHPTATAALSVDGLRRTILATTAAEAVTDQLLAPPSPWRRAWPYAVLSLAMVTSAVVITAPHLKALIQNRAIVSRAAVAQPATATPTPPDPVVTAVTAQSAALQQLIDKFAAGQTASFGIVVKDLKTGATASLNGTKSFTSASLYKLFVAQQLYRLSDQGQLTLTGDLESCLRVMINISSNDCGAKLGQRLGWGRQDASLKAQGYLGTSLASLQKTSAADIAMLLERLYRQDGLSPAAAGRFHQYLKEQRINNRLPQGLPAGTVVAHKTGDLFGYVHDAGIVYGPATNYLVVVMSGPWQSPGQAPSRFAKLSAQLFRSLNP